LGIDRFCEVCRKCADNCPSHALSDGARVPVRGVGKWPTVPERCHGYWRQVGTDCGICMAACPFSHPDTVLHRLVRRTVRVAPWLSRPLVRLDDLFYGRRWKVTGR
jgi:epoxyqueuosine reductase QueG